MQAEEMYPCQRAPAPRAAPRLAGDDEAAATGTCNTRARSCGSRSVDRGIEPGVTGGSSGRPPRTPIGTRVASRRPRRTGGQSRAIPATPATGRKSLSRPVVAVRAGAAWRPSGPPAPRSLLGGVIVGPVRGPGSAPQKSPALRRRPNGKGWKVPDGGRRGVLREVQDEADDLEGEGSEKGQRPTSSQRSLSGLRHGDVQDSATQVNTRRPGQPGLQ